MKKLIELDAAISAIDGLPMDYGRWDVDDVLHALASVPTVDAVPVVRCKDCRFSDWYTAVNGKRYCYCMEHCSSGHEDNDFCSRGDR